MNYERLSVLFLFVICIASASLVLPTINNNIDNPNLIVYFNADEGHAMDLIWYYYSGEKRDSSYQMSLDYGLEQIYLSDLSRIIFSKFIDFKPGTFVLILRWLRLIFWIGALTALWYLIGYHFRKGWPQVLTVLLLAVRPAFDHFSNTSKPDPVVLFFIIIGLNYVLRILEKPCMKYLLISTACASIAFIVKFAGIFLLPVVVVALYLGRRYQAVFNKSCAVAYFKIKNSLIFSLLIAAGLIAAPLLAIFFYVRKTTGLTYYEEFGFLESLLMHKIIFFFWSVGAIFMLISFIIFILNKSKNYFLMKFVAKINEVNSYAIIVLSLFVGFIFLFGFRWLIIPRHFLDIYVYHVREFSGGDMLGSIHTPIAFLKTFFESLVYKLMSFDILILLFFGMYLIMESRLYKQNSRINKLRFYKRLTLLVFLMPFFLSMLSIGRFEHYHMLPFFIAVLVLVVEGINMFVDLFNDRKWFKNGAIAFISILLLIDVGFSGIGLIKLRIRQFKQREDIAFVVAKWFKENVPANTVIVADHYTDVYIPTEYKNIKIAKGDQKERVEQLRYFVDFYHPQLIYYNAGPCGHVAMPPIEKMLPGKKVKLIQSFDSATRQYQRKKGDKFVIYMVL